MKLPLRCGIFGGTFDPPHLGHSAVISAAFASNQVERIFLIPAAIPPHKHRPDISPASHRLAMTRILADADRRLSISAIEIERTGPSYTIDTVKELQERHPEMTFRLIIGADMALYFGSWREAKSLVALAPPLVVERPGSPLPVDLTRPPPEGLTAMLARALQVGRIPMDPIDLSSTVVRQTIREQKDTTSLLHPAVQAYIQEHGLYGTDRAAREQRPVHRRGRTNPPGGCR